ncbi:unnamed protein product [Heligmosomoides polygyrus]|uniref:HalOD1 domain-containing protein n=1 Tax=Heligmosomoides polygyrus TaxID=6339 RepID=A0A183GN90_HELPZ|nr:unnamed protein product [Heligmosomoides polygyrus]
MEDEIDTDHAFRIFDRLEDLVVDESDLEKIRNDGIQVDMDELLELVPSDRREQVRLSLERFDRDGVLRLEEVSSDDDALLGDFAGLPRTWKLR